MKMSPKSFINTETSVHKDNTTNNYHIEIGQNEMKKVGILIDELILLVKNINKKIGV